MSILAVDPGLGATKRANLAQAWVEHAQMWAVAGTLFTTHSATFTRRSRRSTNSARCSGARLPRRCAARSAKGATFRTVPWPSGPRTATRSTGGAPKPALTGTGQPGLATQTRRPARTPHLWPWPWRELASRPALPGAPPHPGQHLSGRNLILADVCRASSAPVTVRLDIWTGGRPPCRL